MAVALKRLLVIWVALLLGACSSGAIEGFVPTSTERGLTYFASTQDRHTRFDGIVDFMFRERPDRDGVRRSRLIFVHGICPHSYSNWVKDYMDFVVPRTLARTGNGDSLRLKPIEGSGDVYAISRSEGKDGGRAKVYRTIVKGQGWESEVFFVLWSDLVQAQRERLDLNDDQIKGGGVPSLGLLAADRIKSSFVNGCLAEVATFARDKNILLVPIKKVLRAAIRRSNRTSPRFRNADFFLISHSLGSRISLDFVGGLTLGRDRLPFTCKLRGMFFMANQIPLFGPAENGQSRGELAEFTNRVREMRVRQNLSDCKRGPLQVVAFHDPADVLSFRLQPTDFGEDIASIQRLFRVFNVTVDNGGAALELGTVGIVGASIATDFPFGVAGSYTIGAAGYRLYRAHTAYERNADVVNYIFFGADQELTQSARRRQ